MQAYYQQVGLDGLMAQTQGNEAIRVGIIDGPIDFTAPHFASQRFYTLDANPLQVTSSAMYEHGTVIAAMLAATSDNPLAGICPDCTILTQSIFCTPEDSCIVAQPQSLAEAIVRMVDAGAHVINLSLGVESYRLPNYDAIEKAVHYASQQGTLLIVASGNQGRIGTLPLAKHTWLIPVVACDIYGRRYRQANLGPSIGRQGVMAGGIDVAGLRPDGTVATFTGTSFAVPIVTGAVALLWSMFPQATAHLMREAVLSTVTRRSVVPPLLDVRRAYNHLRHHA